jgi:hypothetical protein
LYGASISLATSRRSLRLAISLQERYKKLVTAGGKWMAKYLQCSECGKLAFYYDDYVGTEKPFYLKYMRYPNDTRPQTPRCFSCGAVPRLIHEFIKEEKAGAKHE